MKSKTLTKVIQCPAQGRLAEVVYTATGGQYNIQSCPARNDRGGCDRQCINLLAASRHSTEWYSLN